MSSAKWRPFCLGLNVLKETTHLKPEQSLYLLHSKTSYSEISQSYEAARCEFRVAGSFWNTTDDIGSGDTEPSVKFQSDMLIWTLHRGTSVRRDIFY